jgi:hypothetical protein
MSQILDRPRHNGHAASLGVKAVAEINPVIMQPESQRVVMADALPTRRPGAYGLALGVADPAVFEPADCSDCEGVL